MRSFVIDYEFMEISREPLENIILQAKEEMDRLALGDDMGRGPVFRIDVVVDSGSPPRFGHLVATKALNAAVQHRLDVI